MSASTGQTSTARRAWPTSDLGTVEWTIGYPQSSLLAAVEGLSIAHPVNPPFGVLTVSAGVVILGRSTLASDVEAWFHEADDALYAAKRLGRNCAVVVDSAPRIRRHSA